MPHHVYVTLPEGVQVVAEADEEVVWPMRRYIFDTIEERPPSQQDLAEIRAWYTRNQHQSRLCAEMNCHHY